MVSCLDWTIRIFSWHGMVGDPDSRSSWLDRLLDGEGSGALCCRLMLRLPAARHVPGPVAFCGTGSSHVVRGSAEGLLSVVSSLTAHLCSKGER